MGAVAILALIFGVPAALAALLTLVERAQGKQGPANDDPDAPPPMSGARYAYHLTCVYAPKAFLVVSILNFNYQKATVPPCPEKAIALAETADEQENDDIASIDTATNNRRSSSSTGLPRYAQDVEGV